MGRSMLGLTSFCLAVNAPLEVSTNPLRGWEYNGISCSKNQRFVATALQSSTSHKHSIVFNLTHAQQTASCLLISDSVLKC